ATSARANTRAQARQRMGSSELQLARLDLSRACTGIPVRARHPHLRGQRWNAVRPQLPLVDIPLAREQDLPAARVLPVIGILPRVGPARAQQPVGPAGKLPGMSRAAAHEHNQRPRLRPPPVAAQLSRPAREKVVMALELSK